MTRPDRSIDLFTLLICLLAVVAGCLFACGVWHLLQAVLP